MQERGYVVCLLKYILEDSAGTTDLWNERSANGKSVCLGYFGRVSVTPVYRFEDYLDVASRFDAGFMGSRKQLMLYPFDGEMPTQLKRRDMAGGEVNRLPFQPSDGADDLSFCCLSIISVDSSLKNSVAKKDRTDSLGYIAKCLSKQIDAYVASSNVRMPHALMGLLGTEDLCLILLSNDYPAISGVVEHLSRLIDKRSEKHIVVNSHSLLMLDGQEHGDAPMWGTAGARLHFSLKTAEGISYLETVRDAIEKHAPENGPVTLETQIGEYDAALQCPASALGTYLYGDSGLLSYGNPEYQKAVFQSETILFSAVVLGNEAPIKIRLLPGGASAGSEAHGEGKQEVTALVEKAIDEIRSLLTSGDTTYIQQALYRLLKDHQRIASIPLGGILQEDLQIQFEVAVNAIVCAAHRFHDELIVGQEEQIYLNSQFERRFSRIVDALGASMQAACQIDRLCFEEQQSHLQNTGAHHKVLMAYYGVVKDLLQLVYAIPRTEESYQPMLIPLLAFGHTPIISSEQFESSYKGKPAKLISVTLPYHALANIPKYIGLLAHEMFHYSVPADRSVKNTAAGKCLVAVAVRCLLENIGRTIGQRGVGWTVFNEYQSAYWRAVDSIYDNIHHNIEELLTDKVKRPAALSADVLPSDVYFALLRNSLLLPRNPADAKNRQELYQTVWLKMREELRGIARKKGIIAAFGLQEGKEDEISPEEFIRDAFTKCFVPLSIDLQGYLSIYELVLREVPPDLFDIGCVMRGQPDELKAKQYLWQIHSIRNDKFLYEGRSLDKRFDGNTIRVGVILDRLLYGKGSASPKTSTERERIMQKKLSEWYPDAASGERREQAEKIRNAVCSDYSKYCIEGIFTDVLLKCYIDPIRGQLEKLSEQKAAAAIMKTLTGFYSKYYDLLGADKEDDGQADSIFRLAISIIEHYQCQPTLSVLAPSNTGGKDPAATFNDYLSLGTASELRAWDCSIKVFSPKELSEKIISAYTYMEMTDTEPLWFRGEHVAGRALLPGIMRPLKGRVVDPNGFLPGMRRMMTQAKAKILPEGRQFHKAEWLALLQHYCFKTNLLDWSEEMYSALYFATERWSEGVNTDKDAEINLLNPNLFNLAVDFLEGKKGSREHLKKYLEDKEHRNTGRTIALFSSGEENDLCRCFYDLNIPELGNRQKPRLPMAAMTPITNERMKMQAGVFVFFDLRTTPDEGNYAKYSIREVQKRYVKKAKEKELGIRPIPFLYTIVLDHNCAPEFVQYARAIGMRKYRIYPELDSLAEEIMKQSL